MDEPQDTWAFEEFARVYGSLRAQLDEVLTEMEHRLAQTANYSKEERLRFKVASKKLLALALEIAERLVWHVPELELIANDFAQGTAMYSDIYAEMANWNKPRLHNNLDIAQNLTRRAHAEIKRMGHARAAQPTRAPTLAGQVAELRSALADAITAAAESCPRNRELVERCLHGADALMLLCEQSLA